MTLKSRLFCLKVPSKLPQFNPYHQNSDICPCSDVEIYQPFSAINSTISTHTTYLDTTGRPVITFKYKYLTDKHNQLIYVSLIPSFPSSSYRVFALQRWPTKSPYLRTWRNPWQLRQLSLFCFHWLSAVVVLTSGCTRSEKKLCVNWLYNIYL